jgi:3-hydroxypropanoate dehydrogenase
MGTDRMKARRRLFPVARGFSMARRLCRSVALSQSGPLLWLGAQARKKTQRLGTTARKGKATMEKILNDAGMDLLFRQARTNNAWLDRPVSDVLLAALWDLVRWPPTSANCSPLRVLFLKSKAAKEKLRPHLMAGNVDKTMAAPVATILAYDLEFHQHLPKLFPHTDARAWFAGQNKQQHRETTAFRNGTLQAGYFILAARALGLDCGPMSGFDNAGVDQAFLAGTSFKSNFLCNLGYGDPQGLYPRSPRFDFHDVCEVL